jgi:hypothetical protein
MDIKPQQSIKVWISFNIDKSKGVVEKFPENKHLFMLHLKETGTHPLRILHNDHFGHTS